MNSREFTVQNRWSKSKVFHEAELSPPIIKTHRYCQNTTAKNLNMQTYLKAAQAFLLQRNDNNNAEIFQFQSVTHLTTYVKFVQDCKCMGTFRSRTCDICST